MAKTIKEIIMKRDGYTSDQADSLINEAVDGMNDYLDEGDIDSADQVCMEYFGLDPDYLDKLY